jgi:hypothetical protein
MKKLMVLIGVLVIGLMVAFAVYSLPGGASSGYPALDGVGETEVVQEYPAIDGVEETVVNAGMPVPGLEGIEEMVVGE